MSQQLLNLLWKNIQEDGQVMVGLQNNAEHSEPMHAYLNADTDDRLWLIMKKDNRVAEGGKSIVQYVGKDHKLFASMSGQLVEEEDESMPPEKYHGVRHVLVKCGRSMVRQGH